MRAWAFHKFLLLIRWSLGWRHQLLRVGEGRIGEGEVGQKVEPVGHFSRETSRPPASFSCFFRQHHRSSLCRLSLSDHRIGSSRGTTTTHMVGYREWDRNYGVLGFGCTGYGMSIRVLGFSLHILFLPSRCIWVLGLLHTTTNSNCTTFDT